MNFSLSDEQKMVYEYGDRVGREPDRKYWMEYAERHERPVELYERISADGFMGLTVPEAYGGASLGITEMALPRSTASSTSTPWSACCAPRRSIARFY